MNERCSQAQTAVLLHATQDEADQSRSHRTLAPRNNAHDAFLQINNGGGWSSDGLSLLVGLYPLTVSLNGFDSQVHMCA